MAKEKIAVAYSGGLDTSVMVRWLMEHYDAEVITVTGNIGENKELSSVKEKALATGASKAYIINAQKEFISEYCFPALKANALYENAYPMATALGRPLLAKILVEVALKEKCTAVAHGCTGKGNDQVRFEVVANTLAPQLKVIAPLRDPRWTFKSREEEIQYAQKHKIPVTVTKKSPYSLDANLWGVSIECGALEDPMTPPPSDAYQITGSPEAAPNKPEIVTIEFNKGVPVAVNGKKLEPVALTETLNKIGGKHGVGRIDLVENRLVGIKSREIYEAPGAMILHFAHRELERLTIDKPTSRYKDSIAREYSDLVYNGLWFSPLRNAFDAFINETQRTVTGIVKVQLYKGSITLNGRNSPYSLYNEKLATYTAADTFNHSAAEGFIHIWGLPVKTSWSVQKKLQKNK
jgi:argininosuccinate synthase